MGFNVVKGKHTFYVPDGVTVSYANVEHQEEYFLQYGALFCAPHAPAVVVKIFNSSKFIHINCTPFNRMISQKLRHR